MGKNPIKGNYVVLPAVFLCLAFYFAQSRDSYAKNNLKPEEVVAKHIMSIGTPNALSAIISRGAVGSTQFQFIVGASGQLAGPTQWVSEKGKTGFVIQLGGVRYPGEHFAFDGKDVMVDEIEPGLRSLLGDFLQRETGIMKNELLGGVLSAGWPLLDIEECNARMKYRKRERDHCVYHELEYCPQGRMGELTVKMYFDLKTFRHLMTEYRLQRQIEGSGFEVAGAMTNYVMLETFDNFKEVDGLMLPHRYNLNFSFESGQDSIVANYSFDIMQLDHNGKIPPQLFRLD